MQTSFNQKCLFACLVVFVNLSNENFSGYYQYSPYAGVIVNALEKKDKSIEGKCGKFFKDVLDDKYMPNFSRYGDEYKKMTGYDDLR